MALFRKPVLFRRLAVQWGIFLLGLLTAFSDWRHPGCLVMPEENFLPPSPPGLPCLPPTPPPTTGDPAPTTTNGFGQGPVRLTVVNKSELPFSITLTGPQTYIFNVASGETRMFVVSRGTYTFEMMLCAVGAQGAMNLSKMTTLTFKTCVLEKNVAVEIENRTNEWASVTLAGPGNFVFVLPPNESRTFTLPRGEYLVQQNVCGGQTEQIFVARSHRTLILTCQ